MSPGSSRSGKKFSAKYLDLLLAHGISQEELPEDLKGNPVHIPQVNFDVPLEQRIRAGMGPPSYAVRARLVEDLIDKLEKELHEQWKGLAQTYPDQPDRFAKVWTAIVETLELDDINQLIKEHNTFYPIEANLKEDPDTGRIMMGATPWKPKKKLSPESILNKFPADLDRARDAGD